MHATYDELVTSQYASRHGIDNTPGPAAVANLRRIAALLEQVRALMGGRPLIISSGYRCPELNRAVGGAANSAHMAGLAADFTVPAFGRPRDVAEAVRAMTLEFDQLIYEFGSWVHIALAPVTVRPRRQVLSCLTVRGRAQTYAGITDTPAVLA